MKKLVLILLCGFISMSCFKKKIADANTLTDTSNVVEAGRSEPLPMITDTMATFVAVDTLGSVASLTYDDAERINTAEGWKRFLRENPDYANKKEIEQKIIRAEVEEIAGHSETGVVPPADRINNKEQAVSEIAVTNNTSCDLILRYSGPKAVKVSIPPNQSRTISLKSGHYTVAATACGHNYAGRETLSGEYEVVYYIRTVSY